MKTLDPILASQLPMIEKIIADETWLEGERRGCWVSPNDPVVRENVCRVILRVGQQMRATAERQLIAEPCVVTAIESNSFDQRRAA